MAEAKHLPPLNIVRDRLSYDAETGTLTWRSRAGTHARWNTRYAGRPAGTVTDRGYIAISIDGRFYKAHRLAWYAHHGTLPAGFVDHVNGDKTDNRLANLRDVPHQTNMRNQRLRSDNTTGVPGVYRRSDGGWYAQGRTLDGRNKHIGNFASFEDAASARSEFQRRHGYHENHGLEHLSNPV